MRIKFSNLTVLSNMGAVETPLIIMAIFGDEMIVSMSPSQLARYGSVMADDFEHVILTGNSVVSHVVLLSELLRWFHSQSFGLGLAVDSLRRHLGCSDDEAIELARLYTAVVFFRIYATDMIDLDGQSVSLKNFMTRSDLDRHTAVRLHGRSDRLNDLFGHLLAHPQSWANKVDS